MMKCNKCGHNDALALFSSVLCVNSACDFYDEGYAIEKGHIDPSADEIGTEDFSENENTPSGWIYYHRPYFRTERPGNY